MRNIKVLIGSAGTASSINIIKALKLQSEFDVKTFAIDCDELAPGLFLADHYEIVPKFSDQEVFLEAIFELQKQHNFDVYLPTYSKELEFISQNADLFHEKGIRTFLPEIAAISTANNKKEMNKLVQQLNIPIAKEYGLAELGIVTNVDLFVRPISGSSSAGTYRTSDPNRVISDWNKSNGDLVVQDFVHGVEYTIDVFCDKHSEILVASARKRMFVKAGQVVKSEIVNVDKFKPHMETICSQLSMRGVCNFQFLEDDSGQIYFVELNPRFAAGGLMLTVKAGANIPLMVIKSAMEIPIDPSDCRVKEGVIMTRYWEEIFINE